MAGVLQHLRSSTLAKRPNPASMVDGQVAINYASGSPGMFFKDSNGSLVKVGPVHVGSGAPNAVPASGGTAGNSLGEQWLDTSGGTYVFKIWDGSAWRSEAGEFVNVTGDVMTGALGIIAGSAGSPGLYFSGDTDTGLFSAGANQLALATGGTGRLYVDASGNVLIGAASAVASSKLLVANVSGNTPLVIQGGVAESAALTFYNNAASTNRFIIGQGYSSGTDNVAFIQNNANAALAFGTNASERMRLDSSGRLGLGTSSPSDALHLASGNFRLTNGSAFTSSNATIASIRSFAGSANQFETTKISFETDAFVNRGEIVFSTGDDSNTCTEKVRIDYLGRLGIGTTSPDVFSRSHAQILGISTSSGSSFVQLNGSTGNLGGIEMGAGGTRYGTLQADSTGVGLGTNAAIPVSISTNNVTRVTVDSSGNVGIGTTSPQRPLDVNGSVRLSSGSVIEFGGTVTNFITGDNSNNYLAFGTNSSERMRLDSSGRLGLGTSSPATNLDIRGTNSAQLRIGSTSGDLGNNTEIGTLEFFNSDANQNAIAAYVRATRGGGFGSGGYLTFGVSASGSSASAATEALRIDESGRVGIGSNAPGYLLDVGGAGQNTPTINCFGPAVDNNWAGGIRFASNNGTTVTSRIQASTSGLFFEYGGSEAFRVDSSRRLLIGTSSSRSNAFGASTFQLEDAGGLFSVTQNANNAFGGAFVLAKTRGSSFQTVTSGDNLGILSWQGANGSALIEGARIQADVDGVVSGGGAGDLPTRLVFSTTADGASSPTERIRVGANGYLKASNTGSYSVTNIANGNEATHQIVSNANGLGLLVSARDAGGTAISASVTSTGAAGNLYRGYVETTGDIVYSVLSNGNVQNTNNSYGAISDIKLKENIVDANSQWNDLKALQVRNYNFKEGQTHTQIGLVAQEVELVSPGLVTESPDRDEEGNDLGTVTKSVNYSVLYMKAVKALQEAMERIETLEAKVATLEAA